MNARKVSVRVLSVFLVLCMLIGLVPVSVFAAEQVDTDYLFFATDRHTNTSIIGTMIDNMENKIGENKLEYLGLGGDMVGSGNSHPSYNSSTVLDEVTGATSSLSAANVDIVAGIHDMNVTDDAQIVLPYTGGGARIYEGDKYYVYGVSESCISGAVSGVDPATEAEAFVTWANGSNIDKSKVIIVLSHYPLHKRRDDNIGASYWVEALNSVAVGEDTTIDRDVIFFWGHNHTGETSADTAVYHMAPGSSISVQGTSSSASSTETIYFTYANAGYLNAKSSATLLEITDTTITFNKYTNSSYSTTGTVTRVVQETAVTPTSLEVTCESQYYVGDSLKEPSELVVTWSDGSTQTLSGNDLSLDNLTAECDGLTNGAFTAAGTYTVTYTYTVTVDGTEYTATAEQSVTVSDLYINAIDVTTLPDKTTYLTGEELDTTGMVVTAYYNNGASAGVVTPTSINYSTAEAGTQTVTVKYYLNGTTFSDSFTITVEKAAEEGITLTDLTVDSTNAQTDYFVGDALSIDYLVVVATFTDANGETSTVNLDYVDFSQSTVYGGYDLDNFDMYDGLAEGKLQTVKVTYTYGGVTMEAAYTISVWTETVTDTDVNVTVALTGDYGVTAVTVDKVDNTDVADAVSAVISGTNFVVYDISLTFDEGYETTNATKTVTLPIPTGVTDPVVYYIDGTTVTNMEATDNGDGTVSFETTHFSTYAIGQAATTAEDGTTTTTAYVLTDSLQNEGQYLIVNTNAAGTGYALLNNSGSVSSVAVTIVASDDGNYIVLDNSNAVWTAATNSSGFNLTNGSYYLEAYGSTSAIAISTTESYSSRYWTYTNNALGYIGGSSDHYIYYDSGFVSAKNSGSEAVYIYALQTIDTDSGDDDDDTTTDGDGTTTTTTYTYTATATADGSTGYILVSNGYALQNDSGDISAVAVTVSGDTVTFDSSVNVSTILWTIDSDGDIMNNGYYLLRASGANAAAMKISTTDSGDAYSNWTYENDTLTVVGGSSSNTTYYVYYNTSNSAFYTNPSTSQELKFYGATESTDSGESGDGSTDEDEEVTVTGNVQTNTAADGSYQTVTVTTTEETSTEKTVYVLTDSISSGNSYLIVNSNSAGSRYALARSSTSVSATGVTVQTGDVDGDGDTETYIELTNADDELWTVSGSSSTTLKNGNYYLRYNNNNLGLNTSNSTTWTYSNNRLSCTSSSRTYYLRYNNGWTTTNQSNSATSVYFYVPTTVTVKTSASTSETYSVSASNIDYVYTTGTEDTETAAITKSVTDGTPDGDYSYSVVSDESGIISGIDSNGTITFSGNVGSATVKVAYTFTVDDTECIIWNTITVTAKEPEYELVLHLAEYSYDEADIDAFAEGITYYVKNDDGSYSEVAADAEFDADTTYYVLGDVSVGAEIATVIALKGVELGDTYSVWAVIKEYTNEYPYGNDLGDVEDDRIYWTVSDPTMATVDPHTGVITFTGTNYGTFTVSAYYLAEDGKTVLAEDSVTISITESQYVVPGDGTNDFPEYPNEGAVRFDKTATAVGNFSETGIALVELSMTGVPYTTGSELDVVIMLDMTGSMTSSSMAAAEAAAVAFADQIVLNEDGSYNSNRIAVECFTTDGVTELWPLSAVTADTYDDLVTAIESASDKQASGGTPYSTALQSCYQILYAASKAEDYDRQQFCVFVSDGTPTTVTYITSTSTPTTTTNISFTLDGTTYTQTVPAYSTGSTAATFYGSTSYHEYWSQLMINNGVTVYGVYTSAAAGSSGSSGSGGSSGSSGGSVNDTTEGTYAMTNVASSADNVYVVEDYTDTSAVEDALTSIAKKIVQAATNVVVEDMIGSKYDVNFSLPSGVTSEDTDGLSEFYIQILEYNLDSNKERTGDPTVLENFTFTTGEDGKLEVSHTVNGTACSACSHVTISNNVVTKIEGTYFTYEVTSEGEILTWKSDKISTTELVMQYFVYLEDSAGTDVQEQIAAGTYYTNEYATLTYTNYNGKDVQQEFPVPQMTWNGAQVTYVFYLVNEAGQPVNRAGRVVPFAEAVYVTDTYTYSVIWNDLEQSAGLYANYLAQDLVPDVYALYDDDASYMIHVYEDEDAVNLNNHFVIGGDVTDEYNTDESWTNADTTYVFITKADGTKYYQYGTYVADDGDSNSGETSQTYLCKSYDVKDATYTSSEDNGVTVYTVTSATYTGTDTQWTPGTNDSYTGGTLIDGHVYYVDENGDVYTIVQKTDGIEVRSGFDFSDTTVAFAVVWKPELVEDTVVIDFGLDVVIDVTTNDAMSAGVTGVMLEAPKTTDGTDTIKMNSGTYSTAVGKNSVTGGDGLWTASRESLTSVRFHMSEMGINAPVTFFYEAGVNFYKNGELQSTNMYSSVTVVPATTIYYEDSFVTLGSYTWNSGWEAVASDSGNWVWSTVTDGSSVSATQQVDRPGETLLSSTYDANNPYGYDAAYAECSKYSLGSAQKAHVDYDNYATASFSFYGTGFDVISLTSDQTGTITVKIVNEAGKTVKTYIVDTYYGYTYDAEKENWTVVEDTDGTNALYQIPVIKVSGLTYGKYTVTITAQYATKFDHDQYEDGSYDFILDAIRIYDPCGTNEDAADVYEKDDEAYPVYYELRNLLLDAKSFGELSGSDVSVTGAVFIDGIASGGSIGDYTSFGPNNEVYLAKGQAVVFNLNGTKNGVEAASIQLALKAVSGTGHIKVYGVDAATYKTTACLDMDVTSATDLYYDISALDGMYVVIESTGSAMVSVTNVKMTYDSDPNTTESGSDASAASAVTTNYATASYIAWALTNGIDPSQGGFGSDSAAFEFDVDSVTIRRIVEGSFDTVEDAIGDLFG